VARRYRYCPNCERNVGVRYERGGYILGCAIPGACFVLGLIVPLWPVTLPAFWGVGLLSLLLGSAQRPVGCSICGTPPRYLERRRR